MRHRHDQRSHPYDRRPRSLASPAHHGAHRDLGFERTPITSAKRGSVPIRFRPYVLSYREGGHHE